MRRHEPKPADRYLLAAGFALGTARVRLHDPAAFSEVQAAIPVAVNSFERWLADGDPSIVVMPATVLLLPRFRGIPSDWSDLVVDSLRALQDAARAAAVTTDVTAAEALGVDPVRLMRTRISGVETALCELVRALEAVRP